MTWETGNISRVKKRNTDQNGKLTIFSATVAEGFHGMESGSWFHKQLHFFKLTLQQEDENQALLHTFWDLRLKDAHPSFLPLPELTQKIA